MESDRVFTSWTDAVRYVIGYENADLVLHDPDRCPHTPEEIENDGSDGLFALAIVEEE
jgi:hypothetical protein